MALYHYGDKEYNKLSRIVEEGLLEESEELFDVWVVRDGKLSKLNKDSISKNEADELGRNSESVPSIEKYEVVSIKDLEDGYKPFGGSFVEETIGSVIKDTQAIGQSVKKAFGGNESLMDFGKSLSKLFSDGKNYKKLFEVLPGAALAVKDSTKLDFVKSIMNMDPKVKKFVTASAKSLKPDGTDKERAIAFYNTLMEAYMNPKTSKDNMGNFKKAMAEVFNEGARAEAEGGESDLGGDAAKEIDKALTNMIEKGEKSLIEKATRLFRADKSEEEVQEVLYKAVFKKATHANIDIENPEDLTQYIGDEIEEYTMEAKRLSEQPEGRRGRR